MKHCRARSPTALPLFTSADPADYVNPKGVILSERELWACAKKVVDMHGDDAEMRADELLAAGDIDGQLVWLAILKRIFALARADTPRC